MVFESPEVASRNDYTFQVDSFDLRFYRAMLSLANDSTNLRSECNGIDCGGSEAGAVARL
jgi:hypothetical protein